MMKLSKENKLMATQIRLDVLKGRGEKNAKCPGVVRKLTRKVRNLEQKLYC